MEIKVENGLDIMKVGILGMRHKRICITVKNNVITELTTDNGRTTLYAITTW